MKRTWQELTYTSWNWLPADVWRLITSYLTFSQKAKFCQVCKFFFKLFLEKQWIEDAHHWLKEKRLNPLVVFRLFKLTRFIPQQNLKLEQKELSEIEMVMKYSKLPSNLLRCLYRCMVRRNKRYIDHNIIASFYNKMIDFSYRETLLKHRSLISFDKFSYDALELYCEVDPGKFIDHAIRSDNVKAFEIFCIQSMQHPEIVPNEIKERGLFAFLNCGTYWDFNSNILSLLSQTKGKYIWFYPIVLTQTKEFNEFFNSSLTGLDVIIAGSYLYCGRNVMISWLLKENYTKWEFTYENHYLKIDGKEVFCGYWEVFTKKPEYNPWSQYMRKVAYPNLYRTT